MCHRSGVEADTAAATADRDRQTAHASVEATAIVEELRFEGSAVAGSFKLVVGRLWREPAGVGKEDGSVGDELAGGGCVCRIGGRSLSL